jgi:hypothetical protein
MEPKKKKIDNPIYYAPFLIFQRLKNYFKTLFTHLIAPFIVFAPIWIPFKKILLEFGLLSPWLNIQVLILNRHNQNNMNSILPFIEFNN